MAAADCFVVGLEEGEAVMPIAASLFSNLALARSGAPY
jgi:hypothetical protein